MNLRYKPQTPSFSLASSKHFLAYTVDLDLTIHLSHMGAECTDALDQSQLSRLKLEPKLKLSPVPVEPQNHPLYLELAFSSTNSFVLAKKVTALYF